MNDNKIMNTNDAPLARFATIYVDIDSKRYTLANCKDFEGKISVNTTEVPRLGSIVVGRRATSAEISFTMTIYKCTEMFDELVENFIKTGVMPRFTIQTSNEDPATSIGRSTKIYRDCILDGDVLASLIGSEDDFIEQEISGYAESIDRDSTYKNPSFM